MALTERQNRVIDITQKTCSVLSVIGEIFVITTFVFGSQFRKPINRLVFYAAWGNVLSNIATLIGTSGISKGVDAPLCQFQGFVIQWLMPADSLWTLAMACNVWLSFFRHYDAPKLRSLEWRYIILCYAIPFIPAFIFLFVSRPSIGKVYGNAQLWCWVSLDWDFLRIGVFYVPVWIIIIFTFGIYARVGLVIWRWRRQLADLGDLSEYELRRAQASTPTTAQGIRRTDEVTITVTEDPDLENKNRNHICAERPLPSTYTGRLKQCLYRRDHSGIRPATQHSRSRGSRGTFKDASNQANRAALKYCKCASLFFVALIVTWVPSTLNRIYTFAHPQNNIFGLQFAAATVLPLQGFWNSAIYVTTSVYACKCLWKDVSTWVCTRRGSWTLSLPLHRLSRLQSSRRTSKNHLGSDTNSLRPKETM